MLLIKYKVLMGIGLGLGIGLNVATDAYATPKLNPTYTKVVAQCKTETNNPVIYIKQWHLLPSANTKNIDTAVTKAGKKGKEIAFKSWPVQANNQIAIYEQLESWIKSKEIDYLLAEGCTSSQEIDLNFKPSFYGWTVKELAKISSKPNYTQILAHIALKAEAKFSNIIKTLCSDNDEWIKQSQLALSDARADSSYLSRLVQFKDDPQRLKIYLDGAKETYSLPQTATLQEVIAKIRTTLKEDINKFRDLTDKRSVSLAAAVTALSKADPNRKIASVWGGLHASKFKEEMDRAGVGCIIVEPVGYNQDEEKLIATLEELLK